MLQQFGVRQVWLAITTATFLTLMGPSSFADYGEVLVSNRNGTSGVVRIDAHTGTNFGTFAASNSSQGITIGPNGNLYVANFSGDAVFQYDKLTGSQVGSGSFTTGQALGGDAGITFGPDGNLYAASFNGNEILKYNGQTGAFQGVFATGVSAPYGIAFGPDGNLYVGDTVHNQIDRFNPQTGALIDVFVNSVSLNYPGQFAWGPDGNMYIASYGTNSVVQVDASSGIVLNANFASVAGASGLAYGLDGTLYVASFTNGTIGRYNELTGAFQSYLATGLSDGPTFLAVSPVPEPASVALVALGGGLLLLARRRRSGRNQGA